MENKKKGSQSLFKNTMVWISMISVASIAFLLTVSYQATKASVQVTQNGDTELVRTHANTVGELLNELNVDVQQHDELSHELSDPVTFGMDVTYIPSKSINLAIDNNDTETYHTTARTVGELLEEEEVDVKEQDDLSHDTEAALKDGMDIQIERAFQVTFNDGGKEKEVWTTASTVGEFIDNQEVTVNKLDELKPAEEKPLQPDTPITLTRVEKVTDIVDEEVGFTVETRKDNSITKGQKEVLSAGENGLVTREYEVIIKNGKETSRELIDETVKKESKKKVVALGTKVQTTSTASSNNAVTTVSRGNSDSSRTLYMHATAYTANCSGCSGVTATGINLKANPGAKVIAVDPNVIPLGTRVWVEGYGYAVAGDTGGAINGNRIDLFVPSKSKALSFGRRNVKVKVLD
ncbi:ubiquitin-like domain-containing protein [Halobacillus litoralis]|uniref:G5 and 3D domain-containing protein n=1 Tax=Halobacillus litoralis TaxID=45668 RepID=UPI001CD4E505|nr:G5 and 3D domain-containing protein [Halobacillus litoralis]MCA0972726.1 ubiquitin-like domain-containing protein [Halobacillus litoralis]